MEHIKKMQELTGKENFEAQDVLKLMPWNWMLKSVSNGFELVFMTGYGTHSFKNQYFGLWENWKENNAKLGRILSIIENK